MPLNSFLYRNGWGFHLGLVLVLVCGSRSWSGSVRKDTARWLNKSSAGFFDLVRVIRNGKQRLPFGSSMH